MHNEGGSYCLIGRKVCFPFSFSCLPLWFSHQLWHKSHAKSAECWGRDGVWCLVQMHKTSYTIQQKHCTIAKGLVRTWQGLHKPYIGLSLKYD